MIILSKTPEATGRTPLRIRRYRASVIALGVALTIIALAMANFAGAGSHPSAPLTAGAHQIAAGTFATGVEYSLLYMVSRARSLTVEARLGAVRVGRAGAGSGITLLPTQSPLKIWSVTRCRQPRATIVFGLLQARSASVFAHYRTMSRQLHSVRTAALGRNASIVYVVAAEPPRTLALRVQGKVVTIAAPPAPTGALCRPGAIVTSGPVGWRARTGRKLEPSGTVDWHHGRVE
jgi:hypothetical protein